MKKSFFVIALISTFLFFGCLKSSIDCFGLTEEEKSWGTEYSWASKTGTQYTFYTLLEADSVLSGDTFFIQGDLVEDENGTPKHSYTKEYKNAEINEIERRNGEIVSMTINNKKYKF